MSRRTLNRRRVRSTILGAVGLFAAMSNWHPACTAPVKTTSVAGVVPSDHKWTVGVDGWVIQVDGIDVPHVPAAAPEPRAEPIPDVAVAPPYGEGVVPALSPYDLMIHRHASPRGLDWRLVAALMYEESGFRHDSRSSAGAYGLMQIMPAAAAQVGASSYASPEDNVETGVRYLKYLDGQFDRAHGRDRLAIVLAAYNMGPNHVADAQRLATRYGYDPWQWDNSMDIILPLLEEPAFYEALPAGYAQGRVTVRHVERILSRYERYKEQAGNWPGFADE